MSEKPERRSDEPLAADYSYRELAERGQPLPDEDSFSADIDDPAERARLKAQEVEYARLMVDRAAHRESAEQRRRPSDQNDAQFEQEMGQERRFTDPESGLTYSAFEVNRDRDGRPLVVSLGFTSSATYGAGQDILHEYATHIDRPIIVIEHEAVGSTDAPDKEWRREATVESMGQSRLNILDQMGVQDFDVAGHSFGGLVAAGLAAAAGDRVHTLVTIEAPGFEDNSTRTNLANALNMQRDRKQYPNQVDPEVLAREAETNQDDKARRKQAGFSRDRAGTMGRMAKLMATGQVAEAVNHLSPSTHWTTIAGSEDQTAAWSSQLRTARQRNPTEQSIRPFPPSETYVPGDSGERTHQDRSHNSDLLVVGGAGHHSLKAERAMMAEMVATALQRQDQREEKAKREGQAA